MTARGPSRPSINGALIEGSGEPPWSDATQTHFAVSTVQLDGRTLARALIGGCIGNFLEWFDFANCSDCSRLR